VVLGALLAFVLIAVVRVFLIRSEILQEPPEKISRPYILIAGSEEEYQQVKALLEPKKLDDKIAGRISVNGNGDHFISKLKEMDQAILSLNAKEIIFCEGRLSYKEIINQVQRLKKINIRFFSGSSVLGSDDSTTKGKAISSDDEYRMAASNNRRLKRLIDVAFSIVFLLFFPIPFLLARKPFCFFKNCFFVIIGKRTWVGYFLGSEGLPRLREGILAPNGMPRSERQKLRPENLKMVDLWYARNYEPLQDIGIILKNYRYLGG
jgi:hypothetical protein